MVDMFSRMPGPKNWAVWIVLVAQFAAAAFSIGAVATAAGVFVNSLIPIGAGLAGWIVTFVAVGVVWSGIFDILKMVMSILLLIIVIGVIYVAAYVFPGLGELIKSLIPNVPQVPQWALAFKGVHNNPWSEILPLLG